MSRSPRVVVTGGFGLLGAPLVRRLAAEGCEVAVFDDGSCGRPDDLAGLDGVRRVDGDVRRPADFRRLGPGPWDTMHHLAAQANVPASVADPATDFEINARGTLNALEWTRANGVRRFVYPSTVAVYDPGSPMPLSETAPLAPSSPYGASKLAGESLARAWGRTYGLEVVVLRLFNVYGPRMNKYVIHDLVRKLEANPAALTILGTGEQVRDYVFVEDAVDAFLLAMSKVAPGAILNLGSGEPVRIRDLAVLIAEAMGLRDVRMNFTGETWPGDIQRWYANASHLRGLGWAPRIGLREGLGQTVSWLLAHPGRTSS
jgi:UDP-glucose 4-epimerase